MPILGKVWPNKLHLWNKLAPIMYSSIWIRLVQSDWLLAAETWVSWPVQKVARVILWRTIIVWNHVRHFKQKSQHYNWIPDVFKHSTYYTDCWTGGSGWAGIDLNFDRPGWAYPKEVHTTYVHAFPIYVVSFSWLGVYVSPHLAQTVVQIPVFMQDLLQVSYVIGE